MVKRAVKSVKYDGFALDSGEKETLYRDNPSVSKADSSPYTGEPLVRSRYAGKTKHPEGRTFRV